MRHRRIPPILVTVLFAAVATLAAGCATTQPMGQQVDDATITTRVKRTLAGDPGVRAFELDVDTMDGVVTLRGSVDDPAASRQAEQLARDVRGVRSVQNRIQVNGETTRVSDASLVTEVKTRLATDPDVGAINIDVDADGGIVTLSGIVRTAEARNRAERIARDVDGVRQVNNEIRVRTGR
ncbi:MAG: BON domain-containing protein [Thermoanaerobaculia bacterium]